MTDMRATERLLEAIELIAVDRLRAGAGRADDDLNEILRGIRELRRRGDTLVRRDDLRAVLSTAEAGVHGYSSGEWRDADEQRWRDACERLENAIGGKP